MSTLILDLQESLMPSITVVSPSDARPTDGITEGTVSLTCFCISGPSNTRRKTYSLWTIY